MHYLKFLRMRGGKLEHQEGEQLVYNCMNIYILYGIQSMVMEWKGKIVLFYIELWTM